MTAPFETIAEAGRKLRSGKVSSAAMTEDLLARIASSNGVLNAFVTVTEDLARDQARQADAELASGQDRGPLHGIPVAVKDLFATKGIRTTAGSKLFEDWVPDYDASVVTRLREAGAVLLGKTGMHELAYGPTSINPFFGAVRNPWDPDRDAGGSSGGSASAVAAGLAYAAIGTDTGCSVRQPAHCCGIVGHKPTFGLVSKAGGFPLVRTMDHVGVLARSVGDTARVLEAIAGYDPADPYSVQAPMAVGFDLSGASLDGLRVGVMRPHFFEGHADVIEVAEAALQSLLGLGATLVELDIPDLEQAVKSAGTTFVEALEVHENDLQDRPQDFGDDVRKLLERSQETTAVDYIAAQDFRRGFTRRMETLMAACDVFVAPTSTIAAAPVDDRPEDYNRHAWKNTIVFNFTGQPSISVPCGVTQQGLPVGLMVSGRLFEDETVLRFASAYEQARAWNGRPPEL